MKKVFLFLAIASTSIFVSCDDDETTPPAPVATAIVLTSDVATIDLGASVTLTVMNDLAANVTSTSSFFANDIAISSSTFTPTVAGTYVLHATNGTLVSNDLTVTVTEPAPGKFTYNGTDYELNNMFFLVHGEGTNVLLVNFAPEGQPEDLRTVWSATTYDGAEADIETADNYYVYYFSIPVLVDGTNYTVQLPGEAPATALDVYSEINLTEVDLDGVTEGTVNFTTFELSTTVASTSDNESSFGNGTTTLISHEFNGDLTTTIPAASIGNLLGGKGINTRKLPSTMMKMNTIKKTVSSSKKVQSYKK
jgi:hypothetical protein